MSEGIRVEYVPVEKIENHPDVPNVRASVTKDSVQDLVRSFKESGIQTPIVCFRDNGSYFLVSGWRRKKAFEIAMAEDPNFPKEIPVVIREYKKDTLKKDAMFDNLIENIQREQVDGHDLAVRIKMLLEGGCSITEISQRTGKSVPWIKEVQAVLEADPAVLENVKEKNISLAEAKKVAKLPKPIQKEVALGMGAAKKLGGKKKKELKRAVDDAVGDAPKMPGKKEVKYHYNVCIEIQKEMKKQEVDKEGKEYIAVSTALSVFAWILGNYPEGKTLTFDRIGAKYGIKFDERGRRAFRADKGSKRLTDEERDSKRNPSS